MDGQSFTVALPPLPQLPTPAKGITVRAPSTSRIKSAFKGLGEPPTLEDKAKPVPGISLPERLIWAWMDSQGISYDVQLAEWGGRSLAGGTLVDFVLYGLTGQPIALRIMGDYWHGPQFPVRMRHDKQAADRLRLKGYLVVDLMEGEIYQAAQADRLTDFIMGEIYAQT